MSAQETIERLLSKWADMSQAEGAAIASGAWRTVEKIQADKLALKNSLTQARQVWIDENPKLSPEEFPFRKEIGHLISLEARNAELVSKQQKRAEADRKKLEESRRNLRKLRSSYNGLVITGTLHCYS